MNARWSFVTLTFASLLTAGALIAAEDGEKKFQATCPVSGKPAIKGSALDLPKGEGKVYFCCKNCPKAFKADPAKYELQVRRQQAETGQIVQVACPVSGHEVDESTAVDVGHAKVAFCCEKCQAKFNAADDEGKLKLVFEDFDKGFTRQVKCPVSGKPINAKHMVEYNGEKVYFCCPNCPKAFEANPEKFLEKLPQFAKADEAKK
jgi:YHS domain-containing protein